MNEIQLLVGKAETNIVLKELWALFLLKPVRSTVAFLDQI